MPVVGQADDVLLIAYGLRHILDVAGAAVVLEHWDGSQDVLSIVDSATSFASRLLPKPVLRLLDRVASRG